MAETLPPMTLEDFYRALLNPYFSSYAYLGAESSAGWNVATNIQKFIPGLRVYQVGSSDDRRQLREDYGLDGSDIGLVFGFDDSLYETLSRSETKDVLRVMNAIWDARA